MVRGEASAQGAPQGDEAEDVGGVAEEQGRKEKKKEEKEEEGRELSVSMGIGIANW